VPSISILYPRFVHPAIEERYGSWQSQMLLRAGGLEVVFYDAEEPASLAVSEVDTEFVLVVSDPLLVPPARLALRLRDLLDASPGARAALPVSNWVENPAQRRSPEAAYLTLRELQEMTARMQARGLEGERVTWDGSDPAAYFCHVGLLAECDDIPRRVLAGREVTISTNDYVHRWIPMRAEMRSDLLPYIPEESRSVVELGCGEAPLGVAIKARQRSRVVGIELDPEAAAVARKRIDAVYCGDVRHIVSILDERFDCIVASEIIEHVDDPWSLLSDVRRLATPGGRLIISIPNAANASIIGDLIAGRFDYTYLGLACVGHLRFFTRRSIEEMLTIAGWYLVAMTPQRVASAASEELLRRLTAAGVPHAREELRVTGYTVIARNPG
jgi:2-polyprenyl-3-methyl-5-hydroxy-6-metoxy-1,4-benzoquinol methylase